MYLCQPIFGYHLRRTNFSIRKWKLFEIDSNTKKNETESVMQYEQIVSISLMLGMSEGRMPTFCEQLQKAN